VPHPVSAAPGGRIGGYYVITNGMVHQPVASNGTRSMSERRVCRCIGWGRARPRRLRGRRTPRRLHRRESARVIGLLALIVVGSLVKCTPNHRADHHAPHPRPARRAQRCHASVPHRQQSHRRCGTARRGRDKHRNTGPPLVDELRSALPRTVGRGSGLMTRIRAALWPIPPLADGEVDIAEDGARLDAEEPMVGSIVQCDAWAAWRFRVRLNKSRLGLVSASGGREMSCDRRHCW
jgi:hypothetical protein